MSRAVAVLLITPRGIPLIRDPKKPSPIFWKAPGGRGAPDETAQEVAIREVREETGIVLHPEDLSIIHEVDKGSHILSLFTATLAALPHLKNKGNEGEEIKFFSAKEILVMQDFFPNHRNAYQNILRSIADHS